MSKKYERKEPDARRDQILHAALQLAKQKGYLSVTREEIAENAGVSVGLVTHYLGTMVKLKRTIMRAAVHTEVLPIIAQGLAARDAHALKASSDLKQRALASLCN